MAFFRRLGTRLLPAIAGLTLVCAPSAKPVDKSANIYQAIPGESTLTYRLKHSMHLVKGVTHDFQCRVDLSPDTLSSTVVVSADVKTFDSGNSRRDRQAQAAIHADRHPKVLFASDSARKAGDRYRIYGKLTFAGRTRPVDFIVTQGREGGKVTIAGGFSIRLTDYGVKPPALLFLTTEDKLDIRFDLVARDD